MSKRKTTIKIALVVILATLVFISYFEVKTSYFQSKYFSRLAKELTYGVARGRSDRIRFPQAGPYDQRFGYSQLPIITSSLLSSGYTISEQARMSPQMLRLIDRGLFAIYKEKTASGLQVMDRDGALLYQFHRPQRYFNSFTEIPSIIVKTLAFIENREVLDFDYPRKNPAIEWNRFSKALIERTIQELYPDRNAPGGSTLATQIEKFRHSDEGRTKGGMDKFRQMLSASYRAYMDGEDTREARKKIVLDYVNSIPLAALPGYGEVTGLGDGLWAWYDNDLSNVVTALKGEVSESNIKEYALAFKQVLSLFIAHRRPSSFLLVNVDILNTLTDEYLDLLANNGIISTQLRDVALETSLKLRSSAPPPPEISFVDRKAANAIRNQLLRAFGLDKLTLYQLDHFDLRVMSTFDKDIQDALSAALGRLKDRSEIEKIGLTGERTLGQGDPAKVIYSLLLYETVNGANLLRVQTDNIDTPFDLNEGARLDLGSTAKLRTLVTYLEIVGDLHETYSSTEDNKLKELRKEFKDAINLWAIDFFLTSKDKSLSSMLNAAMERRYSASPRESFFTGGGLHTFSNFKHEDDGKNPTVSEAFRHSMNLPFIRLMRDIIRYYMSRLPGAPDNSNDEKNNEGRKQYLAKFADKEGSYFLEQFYLKHKKIPPSQRFSEFIRGIRLSPLRFAAIYRYIFPQHSLDDFKKALSQELSLRTIPDKAVADYYEKYGPGKFGLQDQGYLARVHPLELWLVRYLIDNPNAKFNEVIAKSKAERIEVYQWLFSPKLRAAQDKRIKVLVETEAFLELHRSWKRLGYPFGNIVPSLATAIGSSGDRPSALAELMGIILNDGVRYPVIKVSNLTFAKDTPYETSFAHRPPKGIQLLRPEVAERVKLALKDIVQNGTARRVNGVFKDIFGRSIDVGGKTGTGDHRFDSYGRGGQLISSRVVNRTATFTFMIGDRFFGVVSAHVHGPDAAKYDFTSALAAGLLKALAPALQPLVGVPAPRFYRTPEELVCGTVDDISINAKLNIPIARKFLADFSNAQFCGASLS
jgi:membrane peptidoglycan carboxypeptidase